jgi:hypothetical protein
MQVLRKEELEKRHARLTEELKTVSFILEHFDELSGGSATTQSTNAPVATVRVTSTKRGPGRPRTVSPTISLASTQASNPEVEAAHRILAREGRRMPSKAIYDTLVSEGHKFSTRGLSAKSFGHLLRHARNRKEIRRDTDGQYLA